MNTVFVSHTLPLFESRGVKYLKVSIKVRHLRKLKFLSTCFWPPRQSFFWDEIQELWHPIQFPSLVPLCHKLTPRGTSVELFIPFHPYQSSVLLLLRFRHVLGLFVSQFLFSIFHDFSCHL